jgi:hypothetical protein
MAGPWTEAQLVDLAQRAATKLCSSQESLTGVLEQMDADGAEDEMAFCKALDRVAFECTFCNNWYEQIYNVNRANDGPWICRECNEET